MLATHFAIGACTLAGCAGSSDRPDAGSSGAPSTVRDARADPQGERDAQAGPDAHGGPEGGRDARADRDAGPQSDAGKEGNETPPPCTVEAPTGCTDPDLRYADIEPIIEERCLGCHDGRGEQWPLTSYSHVANWFTQIRSMMLTCGMPPPESGLTMPVEEREKLLLWIRCDVPK